jgi:epoxyqueuosine reductase
MIVQEKLNQQVQADLLLHTCCGPCLEYPARQLMAEGKRLIVYFFNPNIQPAVENKRRLSNMAVLAEKLGLHYVADDLSEPDQWVNWDSPAESRCRMCYRSRLEAAAQMAKKLGIPAFSTTLLVSLWQDQAAILEIGQSIAQTYGLVFEGRDFREGYREGQRLARQDGLYRQRYCGCLPSLEQSDFKDQIKQELSALAD